MKNFQRIWKIYTEEFVNRDTTLEDINDYLKTTYKKELAEFSIEGSAPDKPSGNRWRSKLRKDWTQLSNIVYIKCYMNQEEESRPLIVGITKTGKEGSIDINLNVNANLENITNEFSGRKFMEENGFCHDFNKIYTFACDDIHECKLLERIIQSKFDLFPS